MEHMTLLLVGNPNAGKSTVFNRLTGGHAKVGNWHGVTVGAKEGRTKLGGKEVAVCDLPGIYSLQSMSMEETLARDYLLSHGEDAVLFVAECGTLARVLPLFFSVAKGRKAALLLTKRRAFSHSGGRIDEIALSKRLGIPVILTEGKGKRALCDELSTALDFLAPPLLRQDVLEGIYVPPREGLSRADKLFTNGWFCLPMFVLLLLAAFLLTFAPKFPGDFMKSGVEYLFSDVLGGACAHISSPVLRSFLQQGVLGSLGSVLCFLPQISLLYFFLILLEESGLISRLALITDGAFSRIGLNGRAVFSLLMGFGCTAAAILTTRGLDDKRMQRRAILCLPYIPCSAKLPVLLTLSASFFQNPFLAVVLLYALGVVIAIVCARILRGERPPFLMELAPLQIPNALFVLKSLLFQVKQFIIKTATVILAFFLLSWVLSSFDFSFHLCAVEQSMLAKLCGGLKWLFAPIGMRDWRMAYAALSGLVAKENVAGAIAMLYGQFPYGGASAFAFAVFLLTCSPCVSAIAATMREVGGRRALLYALFQTVSAVLFSYLAYFLVRGGAVYTLIAAVPVFALILLRRPAVEMLHRVRGHNLKKLHREHRRTGVLLPSRAVKGPRGAHKRR